MARKRNLADLYHERDITPWYWRALGTLSPMLILLGFLVFPTSFSVTKDVASSQSTLSIVSVILLALGYSLSVALWFICRSWIFQFDVLFLPCLLMCVAGALNTGISLGVHPSENYEWGPAPIAALALALASAAVYGSLCLYTYLKIYKVPLAGTLERDGSESATLMSAEEQQRKQFGRLLSGSDRNAPLNGSNTYHIGIPDHVRLGRNNHASVELRDNARSVSPYSDGGNAYEGNMAPVQPATSFDYSLPLPGPPRPVEGKAAVLQAARDRSVHNARSRERMAAQARQSPPKPTPALPQGHNPGRAISGDEGDISLSDVHPLEREEFMRERGRQVKGEDAYGGNVWRPRSDDYLTPSSEGYEQPRFEIVEGDVEFDLGATRRGGHQGEPPQVRGELEARMPRERMSLRMEGEDSWR